MENKEKYLYYENTNNVIQVKEFNNFFEFVKESQILRDSFTNSKEEISLISELFIHSERVVATNLTIAQTQTPLKATGTIAEIVLLFKRNYVQAPVIHPLVVGISKVVILDINEKRVQISGVIINSTNINVAHEYKPLSPGLIIETEKQNELAYANLFKSIDGYMNTNIAYVIPIRDAIHAYEEKNYAISDKINKKGKKKRK